MDDLDPIPGFDGYFINEDGTRVVGPGRWRPHDLTIQPNGGRGRLRVKIENRYRQVHALVALTYIGPNPDPERFEIRHLDDDYLNNHWTNLAYGTPKENCADSIAAGNHVSVYWRSITHCPSGHEYSPANTYISKRGIRYCITCQRRSTREWRARQRT